MYAGDYNVCWPFCAAPCQDSIIDMILSNIFGYPEVSGEVCVTIVY